LRIADLFRNFRNPQSAIRNAMVQM